MRTFSTKYFPSYLNQSDSVERLCLVWNKVCDEIFHCKQSCTNQNYLNLVLNEIVCPNIHPSCSLLNDNDNVLYSARYISIL